MCCYVIFLRYHLISYVPVDKLDDTVENQHYIVSSRELFLLVVWHQLIWTDSWLFVNLKMKKIWHFRCPYLTLIWPVYLSVRCLVWKFEFWNFQMCYLELIDLSFASESAWEYVAWIRTNIRTLLVSRMRLLSLMWFQGHQFLRRIRIVILL